jgi:hypothetical protein
MLTARTAMKTKATLAEQLVAAGALIPSLEMYQGVRFERLVHGERPPTCIRTDGTRNAGEHAGEHPLP